MSAGAANAEEVARASYLAFVSKDRAALEKLIAADFHFTSPLDNRLDRAAYFERCWPNSERIAAINFVHFAVSGDLAFVIYEGLGASGAIFRNCEVLTIRYGQVHAAEVYFGWNIPHPAAEGGSIDPPPTPE